MQPLPEAARILRVALACIVAAAGCVHAAGTTTLFVGATILSASNCKFNTPGPTPLAFGSIDPASAADATTNVPVVFRCNGAAGTAVFQVTSDDGLYETGPGASRMRHATDASAFLRYSLALPISGSVPKNTDQTLTVTATIRAADFRDALVGDYADTVVLVIAP